MKTEKLPKIMIADHSHKDREEIRRIIEQPCEFVEATDGQTALELMEQYRDELAMVFLNMDLPGMDGMTMLAKLKEKGCLSTIPVIVLPEDLRDLKVAPETGVISLERFHLEAAEELRANPDKDYFIWYTGINDFSQLIDRYGFEFGNEVAHQMIRCFREYLGGNHLICRIFSDCFVGLRCMEGQIPGGSLDVIRSQMDEFFLRNHCAFPMGVHVGVYHVTPEDKANPDVGKMLACARTAQRSLKNTVGWNICTYDSEFIRTLQRKQAIIGHLDQALAAGEISVFYQPQYDYFSSRLIGAEALCRWKHETLGNISPGEFIPILEESGDISKLDAFIWDTVCRKIRCWLDRGKRVPISINVSRCDILNLDLQAHFSGLLKKYDLDADLLRIEITETAYMEKSDKLISVAEDLKKLGFTIEMDDFGSGFSSLNILKDVPVDVIKLDLRFLQGESNTNKGGNIISYIIRMAQSMNMCVLAEGVETRVQADMLKSLNCGWMQGYYFARPICESDFEALLDHSVLDNVRENRNSVSHDYVQELLDRNSNSSYIFNCCLGGAAVVCYNGEKLELIMANEEAYKCIGEKRDRYMVFAKNLLEVVPADRRQIVEQTLKKTIETGLGKLEMEFSDGRWIVFVLRFLYANSGENFLFVQIEDVTDLHMMQRRLHEVKEESREHYEKLKMLTRIPGMVIFDYDVASDEMVMTLTDADGNTRQHIAAGWMERLPKENWIRPDSVDALMSAIRKVCDGSAYETVDAYALYKDKCYHNSRYHFFSIKDSLGKVYHVIGRADKLE